MTLWYWRQLAASRTAWFTPGRMMFTFLAATQLASPVWSQEAPVPRRKASEILKGLQVQPGDEPLMPFVPANPPKDEAKTDAERAATALYMKGRIEQEHGRFNDALEAYLESIDKNPQSLDAYKGALPILLQRQEIDRARKLTLAAAEKIPAGYDLVIAMAAVFSRQNQVVEGIQLLNSALALPGLAPRSEQDLHVRRDLGLYYRLSGDYQKSAAEYKLVFDAVTDPELNEETRKKILSDPGQLYDEFGDVFLKSDQPELALKAYDQASKFREAKPGLHAFNLATVFQKTGKSEQALAELQHYFDAQMQTRGRSAYELLKEILVQLKRENELLPTLDKLHKIDEYNDSLRYYLADETLLTGDLDRASALYLNGRDTVSDPRALVGMVSIYRQKQNSEKLLAVLAKAFASVPRSKEEEGLQQLPPDVRDLAFRFEKEIQALIKSEESFSALTKYARSLEEGDEPKLEFLQAYLLGKLATENDHIDDAIHFYKYAIALRNDPPPLLYTELASQLVDSHHYPEAVDLLTEASKHTSSGMVRAKWQFLYLLSYALEFQGKTEEALATIREAQKLQPGMPTLHYQEAWIVYHARRWDDAIALFEQVISHYSSDKAMVVKCRFHISNIYVEKGDIERGEKILEEVLTEEPENVQANNDLGYLYADQGKNLERAEKMIRKAVAAEPENYAYLDSLGWVLFKQGKFAEALPVLEKAIQQKGGDDSTVVDHLADCQEKSGLHEAAVAGWTEALAKERKKSPVSEKLIKALLEKLKLPAEPAAPATESK